jgi:hypothetical protein
VDELFQSFLSPSLTVKRWSVALRHGPDFCGIAMSGKGRQGYDCHRPASQRQRFSGRLQALACGS